MKPVSVVFRIRRCYFDQIVQGEKTSEFRADKEYWRKTVIRLVGELPEGTKRWIHDNGAKFSDPNDHFFFVFDDYKEPIAVFICGKDVHRRYLIGIRSHNSAKEGLGREPSDQGRKDLGEGAVWEFKLGEVVK